MCKIKRAGALFLKLMGIVSILTLVSACAGGDHKAEVSFDAIEQQIQSGDYVEARSALESILEEDGNNAEAHFQLGLVLFRQGEYAVAKEHFMRALELDESRSSAIHHNLGVLAFQIGDMNTAVTEFEAALAVDPNDPDTHYQLGATYLVQSYPAGSIEPDMAGVEKARAEFEKSLQLDPGKPEALVGMANIHLLLNELDEAVALLQQALDKSPDMREALFALGRAYMLKGEFDAAKQTLEQFLETDPPAEWATQANSMLEQLNQ